MESKMKTALLPVEVVNTLAALDPKKRLGLGMALMGAPSLWEAGLDGRDVVVGVIDTGIDQSHPELAGKVIGSRDYVRDGLSPDKFHYHGTHVAGTIAANKQLKGVAPGAKLRDYRVLNQHGGGAVEACAQALRDAADDGCEIVNLSMGFQKEDLPNPDILHEAVRYAVNKQVLVICAVGNERDEMGPGAKIYPGYYPEVVGVGAVKIEDDGSITDAFFSNENDQVDVSAPGVDILSCAPGGRYMVLSGTSMASPHASGFAAILLQRGKGRLGKRMTEQAAWEMLKCTTADIDALGIDPRTGAGFLTIYPSIPKLRPATEASGHVMEPIADLQQNQQFVIPTAYH
ncbi:S8 family serine peptidase [Heliobacterium gestii]|uniref:S8 family serine peptidase n=1 Tax=Heliomicrobium gestii TaxID=2699 RepID=A0A845LG43_HELGE|nr:S8 family serine peptidase [Heliomicrobium gestii]MBM7868207.1 major intracellular serine protease [Heliomicrobium gestii]MZP43405.1 S8 family serine peptidase [Heliomicrobium gestii]